MAVELIGGLPPFSAQELAGVEGALGRPLPTPLLAVLRENNGGRPARKICRANNREYYIQYIYPISSWHHPNLRSQIDNARYLVDSRVVPFGREGQGMLVAISELDGTILVCDGEQARSVVGETMTAFFSGLVGAQEQAREPNDELMRSVAVSTDPDALYKYLRQNGRVNDVNSDGLTIAQLCALNGNVVMLAELERAGARFEGVFHIAAKFNERDVITFLLNKNYDVLERDAHGLLPIDYVNANPPLRRFLEDLGSRKRR